MKLNSTILLFCVLMLFSSCEKNDDDANLERGFYSNALTSASAEDLLGVWSIFNIGFENNIAEVPITIDGCGRDFLIFSENGVYTEYLLQTSGCDYQINTLDWQLEDGIITLSNAFGQSDELVITRLNATEFIFKTLLDIDDDGELDIISLFLKPYQPADIDIVSFTFNENSQNETIIDFNWQAYSGFSDFDRYEIYRSVGPNCSKESAILIETIADVNTTSYVDLTPPVNEKICYYLKTYTSQGVLGESVLNYVNSEFIKPEPVRFNQPTVSNNTIETSWQESEHPYFSHYEIVYSNFPFGFTATGLQVEVITQIFDSSITAFNDENPPLLENPFYGIYVYNIFGNRTRASYQNIQTSAEVIYKPQQIISLETINAFVFDTNETIIYMYGRASGDDNDYNIFRYNYNTLQMEAVSNLSPTSFTTIPIRFYNTTANGKEIFIVQGARVKVYNAITMTYKYELEPSVGTIKDIVLTENGHWIVVTQNNIFTFSRNNANFTQVDVKPHFTGSQGNINHRVFALNNDKLLIGHYNQNSSYVFDVGSDGSLSDGEIVPIPVRANFESQTFYNSQDNYLINFEENRLYSTTSYSFLESFEQPFFPTGISNDGLVILGSNNDPDWQIMPQSIHAKEAVIYKRNQQQSQVITTLGYPHAIFQNYNGSYFSISSSLKKDNLKQNINDRSDLFIEPITID